MHKNTDPFGRDATQPLSIPPRGWWQVVERVYSESVRDNLSVVAAGCAFYALLAIFPALSALISLYGLIADPAPLAVSRTGRAWLISGSVSRRTVSQECQMALGNRRLGVRDDCVAARLCRLLDLRVVFCQLRQELRLTWSCDHLTIVALYLLLHHPPGC
jgi:hypothetical protein